MFEQYAQSKLANILFSIELGRREMDIGKCLSLLTEPAKKKKKEKKIRPRLTPVEKVPPTDDVEDLGFQVGGLQFNSVELVLDLSAEWGPIDMPQFHIVQIYTTFVIKILMVLSISFHFYS